VIEAQRSEFVVFLNLMSRVGGVMMQQGIESQIVAADLEVELSIALQSCEYREPFRNVKFQTFATFSTAYLLSRY
jgi:hypothetical protein